MAARRGPTEAHDLARREGKLVVLTDSLIWLGELESTEGNLQAAEAR